MTLRTHEPEGRTFAWAAGQLRTRVDANLTDVQVANLIEAWNAGTFPQTAEQFKDQWDYTILYATMVSSLEVAICHTTPHGKRCTR